MNSETFAKLYQKYLDKLYRYMYFHVNQHRETAEDLVETVFLKAWKNINSYQTNGGSIQAWLYSIAHNTLIDYYRTYRPTGALDETVIDSGKSIEEHLETEEIQIKISKALHKLSAEQKQMIILKFIEGLAYREVEEIMGKSQEALRALQYRALKQLKKYLKHL